MRPRQKLIPMGGAGYGSGAEGETGILLNKTTMTVPTQQPGDLVNQPDDITFTVDAADGSVSYTIAKNEAWLSLDSAAGTVTAGSPDTITVSFDTTDLAADTYTDTITVSSDGLEDQTIEVSMSLVNQNAYIATDIRDDTTEWPNATSVYAKEYIIPCYWATEAQETWLPANTGNVVVGSYAIFKTPSTPGPGGFVETSLGIYNPNHVNLGNTTNTVDMSLRYDGMRGYVWYFYNETRPSDGVYLYIGTRPTAGGTDYGSLCVASSRTGVGTIGSNNIGIFSTDGEGNISSADSGHGADYNWNWFQFEWTKGGTFKLDCGSVASHGSYSAPTWPINTGSSRYESISLAGSGYSDIVPQSPIFYVQSSNTQNTVTYLSGMYLEFRKIGGSWETLVDAT